MLIVISAAFLVILLLIAADKLADFMTKYEDKHGWH